jgi:hypothetical protein
MPERYYLAIYDRSSIIGATYSALFYKEPLSTQPISRLYAYTSAQACAAAAVIELGMTPVERRAADEVTGLVRLPTNPVDSFREWRRRYGPTDPVAFYRHTALRTVLTPDPDAPWLVIHPADSATSIGWVLAGFGMRDADRPLFTLTLRAPEWLTELGAAAWDALAVDEVLSG